MSTTLIRAYESFFTLIDVEGTTEGRALSVTSGKSYAQVFFAKETSSQPRFFFMADIPDTNNLTVQIFTVNVTGSGSSTSYTPTTELASFSGQFNYLNTPDNEQQPFSDALWYYIDSEINLNQGDYYAIVFSSSETIENSSPKIYFSKTYRNEIFPIFLGKTLTEDWSNELVPATSSGGLRTGSFVSGFTGKEVNAVSDFDSGSVSIGGTGASARRGYSTYLYVQKESSITNDVAVQFFQEPPTSASNGTSEETDQSMMRFYYFKKGTLPLSGSAFYNKTINSSPTLDSEGNFIIFTQPDRLPPVPKSYLPDTYMDVDYKEVGVVSIYEGFSNQNHRIEYEKGIIGDNTNRSELEYWAHFAEMRDVYTATAADVGGGGDWEGRSEGDRIPEWSSNPSYLDFSLEQKGNELESIGSVELTSASNPVDGLSESENVRGFTNITRVGNFYIGFPKYKTYGPDWYADSGGLTGGAPVYEWDGVSESRIQFRGIISHVDTPDSWSYVTINIKSDYDPYDIGAGATTDVRGHYPNESVLGNPNSASAVYAQRFIGVHDTFFTRTSNNGSRFFALTQMFPGHFDAPSAETDVLKPIRPFYNLIVSFDDFDVDSAPSSIDFKAISVENADPYDGRFEARQMDVSRMGGTGTDFGIVGTSAVENADLERLYPNIDADYQAAKFIDANVGDDSDIYFTVFNNRHESKIELNNGDRRYGPIDAISKFGIWKIDKSISNVDFRTNSVQADHVKTSDYKRDLYVRSSSAKTNEYKGTWVTGTSYSIDDLVVNEGGLYICTANHTAAAAFETDYPTNWDWLGFAGSLDGRGFDPTLEHEYEITNYLNAGGVLYMGTSTALTQSIPANVTETFFDWSTSTDYQRGDYVRDTGTNYICTESHTSGTLNSDIAAGLWVRELDFKPNMGEVYRTDDLVDFSEVVDGDIQQDWLDGYTERAIDTTSVSGQDYDFRNNDRVVFMDLVENILHVWVTPSANYSNTEDFGTPFHIAHDVNFGRTKVLRKFPIWYNYEEEVLFDLSVNGGNEVDATTAFDDPLPLGSDPGSFEKGTIFNNSGEYYVLNRKIVYEIGSGSPGNEANTDVEWSFSGILAAGLLRQTFLPNFAANDTFYNASFKLNQITDGKRVGDHIYICGTQENNVTTYDSNYEEYKHSVRWLMYDRRTINDAFTYFDDTSYKIDNNANDFISTATTPVSSWAGDGENALTVAPHYLLEFLGSKWGVYHHKTLAKYDFFESSQLLRDYPALNISEDNQRIGKYCYMIGGVPSVIPTGGPSPVPPGNIEDDLFNRDPKLFVQAGICYLITENDDRGAQIYKSYGVKQLPDDWGLSRRFEGTFYGSTVTNAAGEANIGINENGDRRGTNTYNFDLENPSYERVLPGYSTLEEYNSYDVSVSQTAGTLFITEIKKDRDKLITDFEVNPIDPDFNERNIFKVTAGNNPPQNISFLYNLRETDFDPFDIKDEEDLDEERGEVNLPDKLTDPTETNMTLKYAETLEGLFSNPVKIEIPLAQERIIDVNLFDKIMLYNKTFGTDVQPNFFRLESSKLIKNYEFLAEINDRTKYQYVSDEGVVDNPFAEVIIKGLRFSDVNLSGAIESNPLPDKKVAMNGIVYSDISQGSTATNPEDILSSSDSKGAVFSTSNFVTAVFPKPIYINSVSFKAFYDGFNAGAGDLSVFNVSAIPLLDKQIYNKDLYSDEDWVSLGDLTFDFGQDESLSLNRLGIYTKAIRIRLNSGVNLRVNNLQFKTFIEDSATTFTTSGSVFNPELILIDDFRGIIEGTTNASAATAYATFRGEGSSLTFNLGEEVPVNRITCNILNAENTRTIRVEVADNSDVFETVFVGNILNYEYALAQWIPRSKNLSRTVDVRILDTATSQEVLDTFSDDLLAFILNYHASNFSTNFDENQLSRYSFRPNAFGNRTLTIFGSSSNTLDDFDGSITVNTQMDEDGYFADDISMGLGLIERPLNVDFPLKNVRKVRMTVLNPGSNLIRMNGLKIYTPLIDSNGDFVSPQSQVNWNIRLSSFVV